MKDFAHEKIISDRLYLIWMHNGRVSVASIHYDDNQRLIQYCMPKNLSII